MDYRIGILTPNPFPYGNVATNRFSTYARAISNKGIYVKVYILKGTEIDGFVVNPNTEGRFNGIDYQYMAKSTIWNVEWNFFFKIILYLQGIFFCVQQLKKDKINSIILYTNDGIYMFVFGVLSKLWGIRYLIDKSEYPINYHTKKKSFFYKFYLKLFKLFDGVIVMTKELESFYTKLINKNAVCIYFPMTVDLSRFVGIEKKTKNDDQYIACVFGTHDRDCILDTIDAFLLFKDTYRLNVKLKLIGDYERLQNRLVVKSFLDLNKSNYKEDVLFIGPISVTQMPSMLIDAYCLITTPREYSSGGFPTKLGEYLATGNPVLANDVGEISSFLRHCESAYLSSPGDISGISNNLYRVFHETVSAKLIGEKGKEVAIKYFSANVYIDSILLVLDNQ